MRIVNSNFKVGDVVQGANCGIEIEGLAWLFNKGSEWKVWFPDAKDHDLKINVKKNKKELFSIVLKVGSEISITHSNALTENLREFTDVLNISDYHSKLKVLTNKPDLKTKASILSLKYATFGSGTRGKRKFNIWKVKHKNGKPETKSLMHRVDKPKIFDVSVNGDVKVDVSEKTPYTMITINDSPFITLPYTQNGTDEYEINISNHCNNEGCEDKSDFPHYYEIFEPKTLNESGQKVTFELELLPVNATVKAPCNIIYSEYDPE